MLKNKEIEKYRLGRKVIDQQPILDEIEFVVPSSGSVKKKYTTIPLFEVKSEKNPKKAYIYISDRSISDNIIHIPDSLFGFLGAVDKISFDYDPGHNISKAIDTDFKNLINESIAVIEQIYNLIPSVCKSNNINLYASITASILETFSMYLATFAKVSQTKDGLGKNLYYVLMSPQNLAFGTIDPQGCLIYKDNNFNYNKLDFHPIINNSAYLQIGEKNDVVIGGGFPKAKCKEPSNIIDENIFLERKCISSMWVNKILSSDKHLFIIDRRSFYGPKGIRETLKKSGASLLKL